MRDNHCDIFKIMSVRKTDFLFIFIYYYSFCIGYLTRFKAKIPFIRSYTVKRFSLIITSRNFAIIGENNFLKCYLSTKIFMLI